MNENYIFLKCGINKKVEEIIEKWNLLLKWNTKTFLQRQSQQKFGPTERSEQNPNREQIACFDIIKIGFAYFLIVTLIATTHLSSIGELMTTARWMREFVRNHPDYKKDSVVNERICYDLMCTCDRIGKGQEPCPELFDTPNSKTSAVLPKKCQQIQEELAKMEAQAELELKGKAKWRNLNL